MMIGHGETATRIMSDTEVMAVINEAVQNQVDRASGTITAATLEPSGDIDVLHLIMDEIAETEREARDGVIEDPEDWHEQLQSAYVNIEAFGLPR